MEYKMKRTFSKIKTIKLSKLENFFRPDNIIFAVPTLCLLFPLSSIFHRYYYFFLNRETDFM
jgi:hypothetical protein